MPTDTILTATGTTHTMNITIYHNPACSKSRKTLELIEEHGITPTIVRYIDNPPDSDTVLTLARLLDVRVLDLLRPGEADFAALTGSQQIKHSDIDWQPADKTSNRTNRQRLTTLTG